MLKVVRIKPTTYMVSLVWFIKERNNLSCHIFNLVPRVLPLIYSLLVTAASLEQPEKQIYVLAGSVERFVSDKRAEPTACSDNKRTNYMR